MLRIKWSCVSSCFPGIITIITRDPVAVLNAGRVHLSALVARFKLFGGVVRLCWIDSDFHIAERKSAENAGANGAKLRGEKQKKKQANAKQNKTKRSNRISRASFAEVVFI